MVDLETTGVRSKDGDRIIQFGCAIIKNLKVVKTYSYMINPHREIPEAVQNLTHISNSDVARQKDFLYYAPKIKKILQGTIFVAHNVNFDFPFLNSELMLNGYSALDNKAIDTVELAQIMFPTQPSYKLRDLTAGLRIKHLNPHRADSDAYGTAVLLIKIIKKLYSLPQVTLNTLGVLSQGLTRNTGEIISIIADEMRVEKHPLSKKLMQENHIALVKQKVAINEYHPCPYPDKEETKKRLFKGKICFRKAQAAVMDHLHQFIKQDNLRALLLEAPNGTGKTLAYLLAYCYELKLGRKLVVAAPTQVLQEQIINQDLPKLLKITGLKLRCELVKSASHYLDLDGFVRTLYTAKNKPTLVLQMQILVWLTETKTGDLDELQLTSYNLPLFNLISHPGDARVGSKFANYDFWNLARSRQENANVLVTNHAYLANHYSDTIWGQNPYLVIDEAHRFTESVFESKRDALELESLWGAISHLRSLLSYKENSIKNDGQWEQSKSYWLDRMDIQAKKTIKQLNRMQRLLYQRKANASGRVLQPNGKIRFSFQEEALFANPQSFLHELDLLEKNIELLRQELNELLTSLYQNHAAIIASQENILSDLEKSADSLDYYSEKCYSLAIILQGKKLKSAGFILSITDIADPLSCNLEWLNLNLEEELNNIYSRFDHIAFVSASLTHNGKFDFAVRELALQNLHPSFYISQESFSLKKRLRVISIDSPNLYPGSPSYCQSISQVICSCNHLAHVLVLFTNLEVIKDVYSQINSCPDLKDYEILAQGQTGSNARIAKRYALSKKSIILGANSFWEGVDFNGTTTNLVIVTKLPFASPDEPRIKLREERLKNSGQNAFTEDILPRAVLRFRQGMGRLIRNENDQGTFLILDPRIWHQNYGQDFIAEIPCSVKKVDLKKLQDVLRQKDVRRN